MRKTRNLVLDEKYQVLLDANDNDVVYAVNEEDKQKISELYLKYKHFEDIPKEHTVECYKVIKLRDNKNIEDWGIESFNKTYKIEINKLKYPIIKIVNK